MKMLNKNEALKLLESFEQEQIEEQDLTRNACSIIHSIAEQMYWETSGAKEQLFNAIVEITNAICDINRHVRL